MDDIIKTLVANSQPNAQDIKECKRILARDHLIAFTKGATVSIGLFLMSAVFYRTIIDVTEASGCISFIVEGKIIENIHYCLCLIDVCV